MKDKHIVAVLLAAGRGSRFDPGGNRNKLLQSLPGGDSVAEASARKLLAVLPHVVAVVRPGDTLLAERLQALGCIVSACPQAAAGMGASLAHGLRQAEALHPEADGWLIALADMPYVQPETLRRLLGVMDGSGDGADIVAPTYQGQRGNPVLFSRLHLPHLLALEGDQGARGLLQSLPVRAVAVEDAGVLRDVDVVGDLA